MIKVKKIKIIFYFKGINLEFCKIYCTDNYKINFIISNENDDSINFDIYSGEEILKSEICENNNSKEINMIINTETNLNKFVLFWEFLNNSSRGKINLTQIFKEIKFKINNEVFLNFY